MSAAEELPTEDELVDEPSLDADDDGPPVRTSFFAETTADDGDLLSLRSALRARSERDVCRCEECVAEGVSAAAPDVDEDLDDEPIKATRDDELVGQKVWNMFARDSNSRDIPCRTNASIASTKTLARVRAANGGAHPLLGSHNTPKEKRMASASAGADALTDIEKKYAAVYETFRKANSRDPNGIELARAFGLQGKDGAIRATAIAATRRLVERGIVTLRKRGPVPGYRGKAKTAPTPTPVVLAKRHRAVPKPRTPPPVASLPSVARSSSPDPFVADLIAKRDDLLAKAAALDTVITTFEA